MPRIKRAIPIERLTMRENAERWEKTFCKPIQSGGMKKMSTEPAALPVVKLWGKNLQIGQFAFDVEGGGRKYRDDRLEVLPLDACEELSELPDENALVVIGEGVQIEFAKVIEEGTVCYAKVLVPFVAWASKAMENFENAMPKRTELADIVDVGPCWGFHPTTDRTARLHRTGRANRYEFTFRNKNLEVWRAIEHVVQTVRDAKTQKAEAV